MVYIIGLTGNIACGKSQVAGILRELGAELIDADRVAHELLEPGTPEYGRIVERFGREILLPDGAIDRRKLGGVVFADPVALRDLEQILHPAVRSGATDRGPRRPGRTRKRLTGYCGSSWNSAQPVCAARSHRMLKSSLTEEAWRPRAARGSDSSGWWGSPTRGDFSTGGHFVT